jgi:hypothetical protein
MSGTWDALAAGTPGDDAPVRGRPALWLDLPNRRIRDPNVRWGGRGEAARPLPIPIKRETLTGPLTINPVIIP